MFNRAIRGQRWMPKYISSDNDPLYRFHQWQANLRILEVTYLGKTSKKSFGVSPSQRASRLRSFHCNLVRPESQTHFHSAITGKIGSPVTIRQRQERLGIKAGNDGMLGASIVF
jgi:hypothetical protein